MKKDKENDERILECKPFDLRLNDYYTGVYWKNDIAIFSKNCFLRNER
ncbi:MAG: hypothetical protein WBB67_11920 [bacterium]